MLNSASACLRQEIVTISNQYASPNMLTIATTLSNCNLRTSFVAIQILGFSKLRLAYAFMNFDRVLAPAPNYIVSDNRHYINQWIISHFSTLYAVLGQPI